MGGLWTPWGRRGTPFTTGPLRGLPTLELGAIMLLLPKRFSIPSMGDGELNTRIAWLPDVGEIDNGGGWIFKPENRGCKVYKQRIQKKRNSPISNFALWNPKDKDPNVVTC